MSWVSDTVANLVERDLSKRKKSFVELMVEKSSLRKSISLEFHHSKESRDGTSLLP